MPKKQVIQQVYLGVIRRSTLVEVAMVLAADYEDAYRQVCAISGLQTFVRGVICAGFILDGQYHSFNSTGGNDAGKTDLVPVLQKGSAET